MNNVLCDRDARCPFFIYHTADKICCECPIDGSRMGITFDKPEDKKTQYKGFCCARYVNCELYRANMEKYED